MASVVNIINTMLSRTIYMRTLEHFWVDRNTITKGNNAVTARCKIINREGEWRIKCYLRPKSNLKLIYGDAYYPKELGIYSIDGMMEYIDIVVLPWVEGRSLDSFIGAEDSDYVALSREFDRLALELLDADYAHGDIKPENIIVGNDMRITLIDFDAMWHPDFKVYVAEEIGTEGYRHPKRDRSHYTKTIDDYPLAIVSTMLAALAHDRKRMEQYIKLDKTIFNPELSIIGKDAALNEAMSIFHEHNDAAHYRIAEGLQLPYLSIYGLRDYFFYTAIPTKTPLPRHIVPERSGHLWGYLSEDGWAVAPLYNACYPANRGKAVVTFESKSIEFDVDESSTEEYPLALKRHDEEIEAEIDRKSKLIMKLKRDIEPVVNIIYNRYWVMNKELRPNNGKRWTIYEEELLVCYIVDGYSLNTIARVLGRSDQAVRRHILDLGLPMPKKKRPPRKPYIPRRRRKL